MRKRPLGPEAPDVSVISYGAWPLSDSQGRPTEPEAVRVVHAALDGGANFVDTADAYCLDQSEFGHNERLVAKALRSWPGSRDEVWVATKGGFVRPEGRWQHDGRPAHLREACEASLRRLGVDCIDVYQLHAPDPEVPFADSVGTLDRLREEGKIRFIGLSNVTVDQLRQAREIAPVLTVQNRLNPFFREAVDEGVVGYCDREGLGFLAYSPLGGGRLNKKLPGIAALHPIAERHGVSPHAVVLAWVLTRGSSVIAIPAARRLTHLEDSQVAAEIELDAEELAIIDRTEFSTA